MIEGWKQVKLAEYYKIHSGLSKPAKEFGFGYPFLSFSDIFWNYFAPDELSQLVNSSKKEQLSCSVRKGDVFLTRTSETAEELGMSCVALKDYPKATFNGFAKRLRPKNNKDLDPKFIGFYLRSPQFRAEITAYSTLTTRASLNNGIIGRLRINLPPLPTQRKIAKILSAYDDLIENNLKRIKLLEEIAQKAYEEWFGRFKFPGHENVTFDNNSGLPDGWKICNINEQYSIKYGKNLPQSEIKETGKFAVFGASGIMGYYSAKNVTHKAVLITSRGNGSADIHRTYGEAFVTNNSFIVKPKNNKLGLGFTLNHLKTIGLKNYCSGSAQPQLTNDAMRSIKIKIPNESLLEIFNNTVDPLFDNSDILRLQNQHLKEARDVLLPRLMAGMIDVEKLELEL